MSDSSSLLVTLMLTLTAASPLMTVMEVRDGDEAPLTCSGGRDLHNGCKSVTWIYDDSTNTVTLFEHGKIHKDAGSKSDRLDLSEDCSLVLKKITAEDEGRYSCRLSRPFRSKLTDVVVRLTIIDEKETTSKTPWRSSETLLTSDIRTSAEGNQSPAVSSWRIFYVPVGLAVLSVITVLVIMKTRTKMRTSNCSKDRVQPEPLNTVSSSAKISQSDDDVLSDEDMQVSLHQ
ncbi:uncharacterized protein LOC105356158 [Oryzias latipes]|uniref:uncharacterized protein LOC105356158 n=1 Tax=Oryzias latipes TaxID=8090 RepID=UPI0005CC4D6D|nr:uncharacterized protein LOC105356158 [Oryzias latipes]